MAALSIVDFVKQSLAGDGDAGRHGAESASGSLEPSLHRELLSRLVHAAPAPAPPPAPSANEARYVTYAAKVLSTLQATPGLTARQLFDAVEATEFPTFQLALAEMKARTLIHVSGVDSRYGDEIYSLSSLPAA